MTLWIILVWFGSFVVTSEHVCLLMHDWFLCAAIVLQYESWNCYSMRVLFFSWNRTCLTLWQWREKGWHFSPQIKLGDLSRWNWNRFHSSNPVCWETRDLSFISEYILMKLHLYEIGHAQKISFPWSPFDQTAVVLICDPKEEMSLFVMSTHVHTVWPLHLTHHSSGHSGNTHWSRWLLERPGSSLCLCLARGQLSRVPLWCWGWTVCCRILSNSCQDDRCFSFILPLGELNRGPHGDG